MHICTCQHACKNGCAECLQTRGPLIWFLHTYHREDGVAERREDDSDDATQGVACEQPVAIGYGDSDAMTGRAIEFHDVFHHTVPGHLGTRQPLCPCGRGCHLEPLLESQNVSISVDLGRRNQCGRTRFATCGRLIKSNPPNPQQGLLRKQGLVLRVLFKNEERASLRLLVNVLDLVHVVPATGKTLAMGKTLAIHSNSKYFDFLNGFEQFWKQSVEEIEIFGI